MSAHHYLFMLAGEREVPETSPGGGPLREVVLQHETEWLPSMFSHAPAWNCLAGKR